MIPLGLSTAQYQAFNAALLGHHSVRVTLQLLDLSGDTKIADLSDRLLDGQVNIDSTADVTRNCTLSLLDPRRTMSFDSNSPGDGAIYMDRMIRVIYAVKAPGGEWFSVPLFTGPVSKLDRADDVVNVECQGKEVLASGAAWTTKTYRRGTNKVSVITSLLGDLTGETKFTIAGSSARLGADLSIGRTSVPWDVAKQVAASMSRQLFYDGRGVVRSRPYPSVPDFIFESGDGGSVVGYPQVSYSTDDVVNTILVKNGTTITEFVYAPRAHPLSPWNLGRNGVPRHLVEVVEDNKIRTRAEARSVGNVHLQASLLTSVDSTFESLPIPHLDPGDLLTLKTDEFALNMRLRQASIPLTVGQPMSVGYLSRVSSNKKRIRHT